MSHDRAPTVCRRQTISAHPACRPPAPDPALLGGFHAAFEADGGLRMRDIVLPEHAFLCALAPEGPSSSATAQHQLSRIADLKAAWSNCVEENPNLAVQARAVLANVNTPLHSSYSTSREQAWVSEVLRGIQPRLASVPAAAKPGLHEPSTRSGTSLSEIETDLAKLAMDAADGNLTSSSSWQHPGNHVSAMIALGNWSTCQTLQRVLPYP